MRLVNSLFRGINLQLFADGSGAGDGGTGAVGATADNGTPATSAKGVKNSLANVKYGVQNDGDAQTATTQTESTVEDYDTRKARFDARRKGEDKDLFDEWANDTFQKRHKGLRETADKYEALLPTLETLGKKYGVDPTDVEALNNAIYEDDSYYEEEALEKGITVEQLKNIRKIERENKDLKERMRQQSIKDEADRIYAKWMEDAEALKVVYPSFDLKKELKNETFLGLIQNNIDLRSAYEVVHKDEIIPAAMQFTAQQVEQKLANSIRANGARPTENGIRSQSPAVVKSDVTQLSKEDRREIARRVGRGEKISFG